MNIPCLFASGLNQNGLDIGSYCYGMVGRQIKFSEVKTNFKKKLGGNIPKFGEQHTALADAWLQWIVFREFQKLNEEKVQIDKKLREGDISACAELNNWYDKLNSLLV